MTRDRAKELGYSLIAASACEVGLIRNGKGIRCWWANEFEDCKMPELDHPLIRELLDRLHPDDGKPKAVWKDGASKA